MARPLINQSAALTGQDDNRLVGCELSTQQNQGWSKPSMIRLQTRTQFNSIRYFLIQVTCIEHFPCLHFCFYMLSLAGFISHLMHAIFTFTRHLRVGQDCWYSTYTITTALSSCPSIILVKHNCTLSNIILCDISARCHNIWPNTR